MTLPVHQTFVNVKGTGTGVTLPPPAGIVDGDTLLYLGAISQVDPLAPVAIPAGWTLTPVLTGTGVWIWIAWKTALGEAGNYTFTWTANTRYNAAIVRISGAHPTAPIHLVGQGVGPGLNITYPSITTTQNDCLIYRHHSHARSNTINTGYDAATTGVFAGYQASLFMHAAVAWQNLATAGKVGTAVHLGTVNNNFISATIAVAPLPAPAVRGGQVQRVTRMRPRIWH